MAKIIHLVGPSGSGKTSVHERLIPLLQQASYAVVPLVEPGPLKEHFFTYRKSPHRDPYTEALLLAADRSLLYAQAVLPRLHEPHTLFLFDRGLPDSFVYQGFMGGIGALSIEALNKRIPPAALTLALVVDGHVGHERILARNSETHKPLSSNETPAAIALLTRHYKKLPAYIPGMVIIDTTALSLDATVDCCYAHIMTTLGGTT